MYVDCCSVWQQREPVNICFDWVCCYALMLSSFEEDSSCSSFRWQAVANHFMCGVTLVTSYCDWIIFLTSSNFMCNHTFMPLQSVVDTKCLNGFTTIVGCDVFPHCVTKAQAQQNFYRHEKPFPAVQTQEVRAEFQMLELNKWCIRKDSQKAQFLHQS